MGKYIAGRIGYMIITFLVIATFTFLLMQTLPGSPFNDEKLSETQKEALYEKYGLDKPVALRYVKYMANILKGDLGESFQFEGRPVTKVISERIGASAVLGGQAIILGTVVGLLLGMFAALKQNSALDYSSMIISVLGVSIPSFVFAGLLQYWVGVRLQWLPIAFWDGFASSILPTISMAVGVIATMARFMRTEMIEILSQDYIVMAKARGLSGTAVLFRHGLRNALIPIVTLLGPMTINLMTGTLIIEQIFSIPGLGEQFTRSIMTNDYPMIMGTTLFYAALFIGIVFVVDLLYGVIDPRIRLTGGKQ
ncbi:MULTISPECIES: oligopeptide ABC transporter permease [Paenibacillus]|uniref:Peptide ABC transporter permease n=1 Tax=Paenibacillus albilobatus TaxID=2716884 RepID=A0A919XBT9_9BACL|nr:MULTISPECIES: oligopeptide ABC transporter permease [Paenibacillus]MBE9917023.1 ABC transporter permease [Paenibacillus donghaensis]GIO29584.1 peptide ABC transporter permease [Paenibacillus albilobatus]